MSERERRWESRRQRFSDAGQRSVAQAPPPAPPKSYEERQQQRDAYAAAVAAERAALQQRVQAADDDRRARDDRWALEARPPSRDAAAVRVAIQKAQEGINAQAQVAAAAHTLSVTRRVGDVETARNERASFVTHAPDVHDMSFTPTHRTQFLSHLPWIQTTRSFPRSHTLTDPPSPTHVHPPTHTQSYEEKRKAILARQQMQAQL